MPSNQIKRPFPIKWSCGVVPGHEHDTEAEADDCIRRNTPVEFEGWIHKVDDLWPVTNHNDLRLTLRTKGRIDPFLLRPQNEICRKVRIIVLPESEEVSPE